MILAPSYGYTLALIETGLLIKLFHKETLASKDFFLAGCKVTEAIARHMESLTEDQCSSFVTVKVPKKKEKKA